MKTLLIDNFVILESLSRDEDGLRVEFKTPQPRAGEAVFVRVEFESSFANVKWIPIRVIASCEKNSFRSSSQDCGFVGLREEVCVFFD